MAFFHCRGSLYKLLHRSGAKEVLDERRRLNMAFDVVLCYLILYRGQGLPHFLYPVSSAPFTCPGYYEIKAMHCYYLNPLCWFYRPKE
jgi:hypothetical protein